MSMAGPVTNALSFDLEHWYSATLLRGEVYEPTVHIQDSIDIVLQILRRHGTQATFFTVGEVVRDYPDIVREIAAEGHEIASHGYTHTPLSELDPAKFGQEIDRSNEAISKAVGQRPDGFRAPNFSLAPKTAWAIDVLDSKGLRYDSSVFPVRTPMYGVSSAPIHPYRVHPDDPFAEGRPESGEGGFVEFPLAVSGSSVRLPVAGGFYARLFPTWLLKRGIRHLNTYAVPAMLYFHPWEFNPEVPIRDLPWHKRFVSFHNVETLETKFDELLSSFEFDTVRRVLEGSLL
jgi:polysaccharide deacetylase family protein (PEP-CTERM system associated)